MSSPGALLLLVALATSGHSTRECYDHQTVDYKAHFSPVQCGQSCSVTPFFSPDHSVDMYMDLIESATESIDIYTPGENACILKTSYKAQNNIACCTWPQHVMHCSVITVHVIIGYTSSYSIYLPQVLAVGVDAPSTPRRVMVANALVAVLSNNEMNHSPSSQPSWMPCIKGMCPFDY